MRTTVSIRDKRKVISQMDNDSVFQVLEYEELKGAENLKSALAVGILKRGNITLKQLKISLDNSGVKVQPGALSYMKGDIKIKNKLGGPISLGKKIFASRITKESIVKPTIVGTGDVYLESTFQHLVFLELDDEEIIIDDKFFYACEDSVKVDVIMQKTVSSMVLSKEGLFHTKLIGTGIVVLKLPVPEDEVVRCKLHDERLIVDEQISILRTGGIDYTVEKSGTSLIGSVINEEGLVNVYDGVGEVWLIPTKQAYKKIKDNFTFQENIDDIEDDIE